MADGCTGEMQTLRLRDNTKGRENDLGQDLRPKKGMDAHAQIVQG